MICLGVGCVPRFDDFNLKVRFSCFDLWKDFEQTYRRYVQSLMNGMVGIHHAVSILRLQYPVESSGSPEITVPELSR